MTSLSLPVAEGPLRGEVTVPGSKSIANRALVCAALADGTSHLNGLPDGDDTEAMVDGLRRFGVGVTAETADPSNVTVVGRDTFDGGVEIDARLAGTTSRFLTALGALGDDFTIVTGGPALRTRPMA